MTFTESVLLWTYGVIVAAWPVRHLVVTIIFRRFDYLTASSPRFRQADPPRITAIIPAKDEEAGLMECLASVQAQTYPNLDILVVDDRSTDRTGAIAREAAAADPRVRVLTITTLPSGWTGKAHALHVAAGKATGEWFWFLDADTRHEPDCLSVIMEYARTQKAELVSLLPEMRCETFWERVVQPLMGIVLMRSFPLFRVNNDRDRLAFANGQFIMITREAYEAAGGHAAVRDRFVEDIYLAKNVKAIGRPIRTAIGVGVSSTRMYTSLPGLMRGWSRILYDALGRRVMPLVGKIVEPLVFSQTGVIAFVVAIAMFALGQGGTFAAWLLGLSVIHLLLQVSVLYRFYKLQAPTLGPAAWWYPVAGFVSDWIMLKSIGMCLTGRVDWRGTAYGKANTGLAPTEGSPEQRSIEPASLPSHAASGDEV